MHKAFQHNRFYRYLGQLQDLANSYNAPLNSSLSNGLSQTAVTKNDEAEVWDKIYNKSRSGKPKTLSNVLNMNLELAFS